MDKIKLKTSDIDIDKSDVKAVVKRMKVENEQIRKENMRLKLLIRDIRKEIELLDEIGIINISGGIS